MSKALQRIKAFGMTNQMLSEDLTRLGRQFGIELGHLPAATPELEDTYYPQFELEVRNEASQMGTHYEVFYCLEKAIRSLISDTLEASEGPKWWDSKRVPKNIHGEVGARIQKEIDSGMTRRSSDELDYTTFGELSVIITSNWDLFGGMLKSPKAVERVMANLNSLRGPIAHCSPLAEDEVLRLRLAVRDWFRLME
jgi:hypothetical protein